MNYDFKVEKRPIFTKNVSGGMKLIDNRQAIVNAETDAPIHIVGNNYELVEHKDVLDKFRNVMNREPEKVNLTIDGGVMFANFNIDVKPVEVKLNDIVSLKLRVFNSYNYKTPAGFEIIGNRLACMNGMVLPKTMCTFSFKHMKNEGLNQLLGAIENSYNNIPDVAQKWMNWANMKADKVKYEEFVKDLDLTENTESNLIDKFEENATIWDTYNYVTYYTTHEMVNRGKNKLATQRSKSIDILNKFYKRW